MKTLKIAAIVIGILLVIVIAIPFFIDANVFRPRLQSELSQALGREVNVGNLSLSLFSGSVQADNISIADDAGFSKSPFVQAKSLKVGVELMPLIFSKALNVTEITLNQPQISLVRSQDGDKWNFSSLGSKGAKPATPSEPSASGNANFSVHKLNINDGSLSMSRSGSAEPAHVYDKVNIEVNQLSLASALPFKMSANLPAGGSLKLDGQAGPLGADDAAQTPLQAKVTIQQMNLAASGFIDPASGISGIADFDGNVASDGHQAKTDGTLRVAKLQVVKKGSPAGKTVQVQYGATYDLAKRSGTLTHGEVSLGKAVSHLTGTYDSHGATTAINMKLSGQNMPVDDLEAMLPAFGVILPSGSQLKGGTLNINLATAGPVDKLVTSGTIQLENSELAGFNLGSKLSTISALTGKSTGGNDTSIKNFSSEVHVAPDGTKADNINLNIPAFGVVTGAGTVSPANALNFKMNANLNGGAVTGVTQMAGLGSGGGTIPFSIEGTTSDPKFVPDVKGMAGGLLKNALSGKGNGKSDPVSGVMGLFKKKPH